MTVQAGRGDPTGIDLLARIRPWWGRDGMVAIWSGGAAIDLYGDGGDLDAAMAVHDEVVEVVGGLWQRPSFAGRIRLGALLIGQLASHTERVATSQRGALVHRAEVLADAAQQALSDVRGRGQTMGPEGQAWLLRVVAELARLRWAAGIESPEADALVTAWDQAVAAFDSLGQPYEASRSRARLAEVLRAVGRRDEAVVAARRAHDDARRIGATTVLAAVRGLGLGIGDHDDVGSGQRSGGAGAPRRVDELTRREQEIVVLVAEGRSNGEIGRQLYISAKTVSVHVSNIMAKLGAASRTEAAAVARRRGLLPN
jgi:DNA-binding CsgD family transcriptional regulator